MRRLPERARSGPLNGTTRLKRSMPERDFHVGVDATSWSNDRGFGRFTRELVSALAARESGFRYTLLFDRLPAQALPPRAAVLCAATDRTLNESAVGASSRSLGYLWAMGRLARRERFDLIFFPTLYSYFPLFAQIPCIVCFHDATAERMPELLFPTRANRLLWRAKTWLARRQATRAMTISQASAGDLERLLSIPRDRIDVVTEAPAPAFRVIADPAVAAAAKKRHGLPEAAKLLVHVGGMNPHKNILRLLEAMPRVIAEHREVHLAIVGDTSGKGFWDNVEALRACVSGTPPLAEHVHFTGYLSDEALTELLNGAEALVFPSLWEGFGLPAVEAMACGVPVLASRRGSLPEVVGEAGLYFDPEDVAAIAESILELLGHGDLRARLAGIARQRAALFRWERAAELAEASFRRALRITVAHTGDRGQVSGGRNR
jgi:glycosyltransferase involved in cell wall biosynthesis